MTNFIINDYVLKQEAKEIAMQAHLEWKEYGASVHEMMHQMCDGHEWVIHTYKAMILCAECDTTDGEEYLDDIGQDNFIDLKQHACAVAFATLLGACHEAYAQMMDYDIEIEIA